MYRAFAPFFETVRGDRRVTGCAEKRGRLGGFRGTQASSPATDAAETAALPQMPHGMGGMTMLQEAGGHLAGVFSRESGGGEALMHLNVCLRH